jgi:hypothetical protein
MWDVWGFNTESLALAGEREKNKTSQTLVD